MSELVPKLRFGEFSEQWKLESLRTTKTKIIDCEHKTAPYVDYSDYLVIRTNNIKNGSIDYSDIKYTTPMAFSEWTKRATPKYGEVLFTREAPAGESCLVPKNKKLCLGQRMVLLQPNDSKINGVYLSHYLQAPKTLTHIKNFSIGTTVSRINIQDIHKIPIASPVIKEQQKIADFLTSVDRKISQLTENRRLLIQYKKGVMQQIFSQQLRFKDDDGNEFGEWEEVQLQDVFDICYGKDFKHLNKGNVPVLGTGGVMTFVDSYLYDKPSVLIGRKGTIDKPQFITSPFWTVDTLFYTKIKINYEPKFVFYICQMINWKKYNEATGVPSLNTTSINKIKVFTPNLIEQQKIIPFIEAIDAKIDATNQQLEQAKLFKKGLLQQMFV